MHSLLSRASRELRDHGTARGPGFSRGPLVDSKDKKRIMANIDCQALKEVDYWPPQADRARLWSHATSRQLPSMEAGKTPRVNEFQVQVSVLLQVIGNEPTLRRYQRDLLAFVSRATQFPDETWQELQVSLVTLPNGIHPRDIQA